jgi:hypothetical protein
LVFEENDSFWHSALNSNLYPGQIIRLNNFKILEWIPSSPGRYHTIDAKIERESALRRHFENEKRQGVDQRKGRVIELRPNDKRSMVKGGLGSLRVGPKQLMGNLKYIMCASSSGVSHEGIVVLLEKEFYKKLIEEIKAGRNPTVNIIGRVMLIPKELSLINFEYHREVPKYYLDVEECNLLPNKNPNQGIVSVAITYAREEELSEHRAFSYSFCQFAALRADLSGIADWLTNYAVKHSKSESPIIIGDYDEYHDYFEKVEFPISDIANGKISIDNLYKFKKLFDFQINEKTMGDKNIFNNSQIGAVGSNATSSNNSFQQINHNVPENLDYDKLHSQLIQLRENLATQAKSPEEFRAIGEVAEAELASKEKDGNKVINHLKDAGKWVFNTAKDIGVDIVTELIKKQMEL